jgi:23S rRNA pseudouridine1911/1915/1917 synthase
VREFAPFEAAAEPFIAGESGRYVAVFKPAGMHSAPLARGEKAAAESVPDADIAPPSLLSWLLVRRPELAAAFAGQSLGRRAETEFGMLSRLDRETSGLILFAKTPEAFAEALRLQAAGSMKKSYRLIAASSPAFDELPGSRPGLCPDPRIEQFFSQATGAASAGLRIESYFRPYGEGRSSVACLAPDSAESFRKERSSESYATVLRESGEPMPECMAGRRGLLALEAVICAGFRHQIRAHLAWTGHPILGDGRYRGAPAPRLFLESHRVEIIRGAAAVSALGPNVPDECFELYGGQPLPGCAASSLNDK